MREPLPQVTPFLRVGGREWFLPTAMRALAHRNYRLYWIGQLVSLTGTWMQSTAQQWLVYRLTHSAFALGTVTFLGSLPVMLLSLFAGVVTDRVDKRRVLVLLQVAMMALAFALAGLTATGLVRYWHVLVLATLLGLANTFDMPVRQAFTAEMVGREDLMNAIALNSSIFNGARLIGPAVAGVVIASIGEAAAFTVNGLSFLAVIGALLAMTSLPARARRAGPTRPLADLSEGLRYIGGQHVVLSLCVMAAIPSVFGFPFTTLIPVMASGRLNLAADGFGLLISSMGVGALVGAVSLAALGRVQRTGLLLIIARTAFALALAVFAVSRWVPLSCVALAVSGWGMVTHLATTNTLLQLETPDALRGRVMGAYLWGVVGTAPAGALLFGSAAEHWGAPAALMAGAAVCLVSALGSFAFFPHVRRM